MATQKYNTASRQLLAQARAELDQGDIRQASEKGWGAAAQMVKTVAQARGWPQKPTKTTWPAGSPSPTASTSTSTRMALSSRTVRRHLDQIEILADALEATLPTGDTGSP